MGKSSGKSSQPTNTTQTITQNADPWAGQQPYLRNLFGQSQAAYQGGGPMPYPYGTYAPFSTQTEAAMQLQQDRALAGSPVMNQARNLTMDTLGGAFVNPQSNPYLPPFISQGAEQIMPQIDAAFGGAGRTGSGAHAAAVGRGLGDLATGLYGGSYENERQRQMQSNLFAPTLAQADYQDIAALGDVGRQIEAQAGRGIADRIGRYDALQMRPELALDAFGRRVGGQMYGSSGSSTTTGSTQMPSYSNVGGQLLGGGLLGAGVGSQLFGAGAGLTGAPLAGALAPWALGGAALGGLFGLF